MKLPAGIATTALLAAAVMFAAPVFAQEDEAAIRAAMEMVNVQLAAAGESVRLEVVELYTAGDHLGRTVFFSNRGNKQLGAHFVPADPRRGGADDITWVIDGVEATTASGLGLTDTADAIDRAMDTWQAQRCSEIPLRAFGAVPFDFGYVQNLLGFGGVAGWLADVTHAGWLPAGFFDALAPGGSSSILGVTFTLVWIDGTGAATDIDNNGKSDVAFREIYYNDAFAWAIDGNIDVETVALHEAGHGLSQAHFGELSRTDANGKFHFAPRAVMNAGYTGVQQKLEGTDNGGHCSIWGSWPNR